MPPFKITPKKPGKANLVSQDTWEKILAFLENSGVVFDPTQFEEVTKKGIKHVHFKEEALHLLWDKDTRPPFWPTYFPLEESFTLTDGFVLDYEGGNANADCLNLRHPSEIGAIGGERTKIDINIGDFIYVKVIVDKSGIYSDISIEVTSLDKVSFNPTPTASGGTGLAGEFWFKIAKLHDRLTTATAPFFITYLAGSHITLRHRGHNLDLKVKIVHISGGTLTDVSYHYLCWRAGDYVGKFEATDTKPAANGIIDTDTITYIAS